MSDYQLYNQMNQSLMTVQAPAKKRPVPAQLPIEDRVSLRKLPFERMHNFRELGGITNHSGQGLKWGMIYRSDKISGLSEQDQEYLELLGLKLISDFRSNEERESAPHSLHPQSQAKVCALPVSVEAAEITKMVNSLRENRTTADDMADYLMKAYWEMVEAFTPTYSDWMHGLLDANNYPQVFHCSAGKDRTGFAAAILLRTLDVPMETVMQDYMATNDFTAERINTMVNAMESSGAFQVNPTVMRTLFSVESRYLENAFAAIDEFYGDFDTYLEVGIGFDSDKRYLLKALLLDEGPQGACTE